jgi:hypothetical protein
MDDRERRMGINEALFREVNERLRGLNETFGALTNRIELVCECADGGCADRTSLSRHEYEALRAQPDCFVTAPGHVAPGVEAVVAAAEGWEIVRKHPGDPAKLADATDPRS